MKTEISNSGEVETWYSSRTAIVYKSGSETKKLYKGFQDSILGDVLSRREKRPNSRSAIILLRKDRKLVDVHDLSILFYSIH